jgi:hypothetical protein
LKVLLLQSVLTAAGVHAPAAAFGEIAFAISPQRGIRQNSLPMQSVLTAAGVHAPAAAFGEIAFAISPQRGI